MTAPAFAICERLDQQTRPQMTIWVWTLSNGFPLQSASGSPWPACCNLNCRGVSPSCKAIAGLSPSAPAMSINPLALQSDVTALGSHPDRLTAYTWRSRPESPPQQAAKSDMALEAERWTRSPYHPVFDAVAIVEESSCEPHSESGSGLIDTALGQHHAVVSDGRGFGGKVQARFFKLHAKVEPPSDLGWATAVYAKARRPRGRRSGQVVPRLSQVAAPL